MGGACAQRAAACQHERLRERITELSLTRGDRDGVARASAGGARCDLLDAAQPPPHNRCGALLVWLTTARACNCARIVRLRGAACADAILGADERCGVASSCTRAGGTQIRVSAAAQADRGGTCTAWRHVGALECLSRAVGGRCALVGPWRHVLAAALVHASGAACDAAPDARGLRRVGARGVRAHARARM